MQHHLAALNFHGNLAFLKAGSEKKFVPPRLALAGVGFGTIASFITLYFASRHWQNASASRSVFSASASFLPVAFANTINRWGGYQVAIVSLAIECFGLVVLWLARGAEAGTGRQFTGSNRR